MLFNPAATKLQSGYGERTAATAKATLRRVGLRPTRQRLAIARLLFGDGHRHVTPDMLHAETLAQGETLSVATVYNTLNQFAEAGLVRKINLHGDRTYFDTNTGDHAHFHVAGEDRIIDIPSEIVSIGPLPAPPPGYKIRTVDILIQLERDKRGN
ncbi:transcriptional repressor [Ochrobactrum sp. CM-21-5]|nr:Fur family transcriptional regulator [Ochrobactrum sp. CM-21-5]MBC2884500.1 transcriptional repressor [Ochrobactrum sp. CM-21-5]